MSDNTNKVVQEFFRLFSRFEFALKQDGYISGRVGQNARADWDRFVSEHKNLYTPNDTLTETVDYFLQQPPKKQRVIETNGYKSTKWVASNIESNAPILKTLTDLVLIVRNNLFHGGKYGEKEWDDETRIIRLVEGATDILNDVKMVKEKVRVYCDDWA